MDTLRVCLVGWILGSKKKNIFGGYLVRGRGGKKIDGVQVFSLWTHQNVFSKIKRKLGKDSNLLD